MTLNDILQDIHALEDELRVYERKYNVPSEWLIPKANGVPSEWPFCKANGVPSETFYKVYTDGKEPPDDTWVRDWTAWASAYQLWLRRREQHSA